MKRKPLIILVIFTALHVSCNEASMDDNIEKANGQGERNIQAWHTVSMTFTGGDLNALDSVVTENYIDHTPIGDITGRDSLKSNIMRMRSKL